MDVLSGTASKAAFQRVLDNVFEPVLRELQTEESSQRQKTELTPVTLEHTLANQPPRSDNTILGRIFQAGAQDSTNPVARKRLYAYASRKGYEGEE